MGFFDPLPLTNELYKIFYQKSFKLIKLNIGVFFLFNKAKDDPQK